MWLNAQRKAVRRAEVGDPDGSEDAPGFRDRAQGISQMLQHFHATQEVEGVRREREHLRLGARQADGAVSRDMGIAERLSSYQKTVEVRIDSDHHAGAPRQALDQTANATAYVNGRAQLVSRVVRRKVLAQFPKPAVRDGAVRDQDVTLSAADVVIHEEPVKIRVDHRLAADRRVRLNDLDELLRRVSASRVGKAHVVPLSEGPEVDHTGNDREPCATASTGPGCGRRRADRPAQRASKQSEPRLPPLFIRRF